MSASEANVLEAPTQTRIVLSPPDIGLAERRYVQEAFETNWVAPVGPHLSAFEAEMCEASGVRVASTVCGVFSRA